MADEMSTEPTPENLVERLRQVDPEFPRQLRADAADLIEAQAATIAALRSTMAALRKRSDQQQARIDELEAAQPDALKVAVCEALIAINAEDSEYPIIPPTAVDWIGNAIVRRVLAASPDTPETRP